MHGQEGHHIRRLVCYRGTLFGEEYVELMRDSSLWFQTRIAMAAMRSTDHSHRPVLPTKSFDDFKGDLLSKVAGDEKTEDLAKPEFHFLDINQEEAEDQDTVAIL